MNLLGSLLVIILFAVLIQWLGLVTRTKEVVARSRDSITVLGDPDLDDEEKQARLQRHAVHLFALLGLLVLGGATAMLVPLGIVWLLEIAGILSLDGVMTMLMRWDFMIATTVVGIGLYLVLRRRNS